MSTFLAALPVESGQLIDLPDLPHAWSTPYLWAWDSVRIVISLLSLYLLYLLMFAAFRSTAASQRALTISMGLAVLTSFWSQVERIGRPVSWRLPVVTVMAVLGVWGTLQYMTGGRRWRDFTLRSYFIVPAVQPSRVDPDELVRRLREPPPDLPTTDLPTTDLPAGATRAEDPPEGGAA